jgi:hypothetical protein
MMDSNLVFIRQRLSEYGKNEKGRFCPKLLKVFLAENSPGVVYRKSQAMRVYIFSSVF